MEKTDELEQEETSSTAVEPIASSESTPVTAKEVKTSRFKALLGKFKKFAKTRKGKVIIGFSCLTILLIIIGIGFIIYTLTNKVKPDIKVAENIASDKIYDNYDYIYNSGDNKLIASTIDKVKQLEIVSGEEKIMDYIISPDKKRIAYSLTDKEYKNKVKAENMSDLAKLTFQPIAFKIYELNLETGENKLIWEINEIKLGKTKEQIYKQIPVVHPDQIVSYTSWDGTPASYPVSYITYEDDVESGYISNYLPWDLQLVLRSKKLELVSYDTESKRIAFTFDSKLLIYNNGLEKSYDLPVIGDPSNNGCHYTNGEWISEYMKLVLDCFGPEEHIFKLEDSGLKKMSSNKWLNVLLMQPDYAIASIPQEENSKDAISLLEFPQDSIQKIIELADDETAVPVESKDLIVATWKPTDSQHYGKDWIYTFHRYNPNDNKLEKLFEIVLPSDIYGLSFDSSDMQLFYYRKYQASTESIIEYRILDINTNEEKELLTIKVANDSVLYYKPKLVWLEVE